MVKAFSEASLAKYGSRIRQTGPVLPRCCLKVARKLSMCCLLIAYLLPMPFPESFIVSTFLFLTPGDSLKRIPEIDHLLTIMCPSGPISPPDLVPRGCLSEGSWHHLCRSGVRAVQLTFRNRNAPLLLVSIPQIIWRAGGLEVGGKAAPTSPKLPLSDIAPLPPEGRRGVGGRLRLRLPFSSNNAYFGPTEPQIRVF